MARNPVCSLVMFALAACSSGATSDTPHPTPNDSATPSIAALERAAAVQGDTEFVAHGNEPFWNVETHAGRVVYSSPEVRDGKSLESTVSIEGDATRFSATMDGAPLVLEVRKAACTDDMSGFAFSHEARLTRGGETLRGCARLASEPQPTE